MQDAITVPYKFSPRFYQIPLLKAMDDGFKRAVWVAHRRSGKDKTCINIIVKEMLKRVGNYYYFLPTYGQAKKIIWEGRDKDGFAFIDHFPKELIQSKNDTELKIVLKNGSLFQLIGTENINSIMGTNPVGCVFSEYSLQKGDVWDYIRPILTENGGFAIFIFTPRGRNHGFKILQQARDSDNWFYQVLTVKDTNAIAESDLVEELAQMPQDLFEQEYYCKFIEGAGQFFRNIDACVYDDRNEPEPVNRFHVEAGKLFRLGLDIAKTHDYTVITPFDLNTFKVGKQERFNQMDYLLQKAKVETEHYKYNKASITMDSTGVGEPIYEDLSRTMPVTSFKFTEESRRNLLTNLQLLLEREKIKIPNDPILLDELRSFRYELSENGKVKIVVPEGLHDDMVFSLALAVWDAPANPIPFKTQADRQALKQFDYYRQAQGNKMLTGSIYLRDKQQSKRR